MGFFGWLSLFAVAGLFFSLTGLIGQELRGTAWFRWGGLAAFLVLVGLTGSSATFRSQADAFINVLSMAAAAITWAPFGAFFATETIWRLGRAALSLDALRVPPSLSRAEAAEARRDYDEALRLYRRAALNYPKAPEPHRRMAELYLKIDRPDDAIRSFREAQDRDEDPGAKLVMTFAIAEVLADVKGDLRAAASVLQNFLAEHPDSKSRAYVEERIQSLSTRLKDGRP